MNPTLLTMKQVAERLQVSPTGVYARIHRTRDPLPAIRNLRHGRTSPSVETLVRLRRLTGRPLDGLVVDRSEHTAA